MKTIKNGIFKENPLFVLLLGLCPALAITTKFENAYIMGICLLFILTASSFIVSCIKKYIPDNVKIPVFILIIGTFVTITEMILKAYIPALYKILGIYLPLIVVNCIVLGRCLAISSKEKITTSVLDAIGIGIGYTLSLMLVALIREILGTNTITLMDGVSTITGYRAIYTILPKTNLLPIPLFIEPAGAFLTLGIVLGIIQKKRGEKHESN